MTSSPPTGRGFIGRASELALLHACRRELARRHGSLVLVGGPAGIGKSRLLAEFCRTIGGGRAPALVRTECTEFGARPFEPIRTIVAALSADGEAGFEAAAGDAMEGGTFFRSIERILCTAARKRSLVLCIEDVHWADPTTLEFLAFLVPRIASERILLIATYRDDEIEARTAAAATIARMTRAPAVHRIRLQPFDDGEMSVLVDSALAAQSKPPPGVLRNLIARAEGNPFHAEELLRGLLEGATLERVPQSIEALVRERFGALEESDRTVLLHAAVLGYRFDPEILSAIVPTGRAAVADALRAARERNLVVEESRGGQFRFRHALTHEAIAGRMLEFEARPLHARVARLFESLPDASRRLDDIAYHWWKALDRERAVTSNEAAGDAAMNVHAYADAATSYERALGLSADRDTECRLCVRVAAAVSAHGDQAGAISYYERALRLELDAGRYSSAGEIVRRLAGRLVYAGRESEGRARLDEFLQTYRPMLSDVEALLVEGWPILIDLGGGGVRAWRERFVQSDTRAASAGDAFGLLLLEANAHAAVGDRRAWRAALERLRTVTRDASAIDRAWALFAGALTASYDGTDEAFARSAIEETHEFCDRHGLESLGKYVFACDAFDRYLHGDVRGAQSAARRALADPGDANQRANMAIVAPSIGLDLDDGELSALANDDALLAALDGADCSNSAALAATGVANRFLSLAQPALAERILERAVEALQTLFGAQLLLPLAARYVSTPRARERIDELLGRVHVSDVGGLATGAMVRAVFAGRDGTPDRVDVALRAAAVYARLNWPLLQAQALELAGDVGAARETYMRCGALRQVRRLTRAGERSTQTPASPALQLFSPREREIAGLVADGLGNVEIAARLGLSVKTIESHLSRIYARLGLRSRASLASLIANEARREA